MYKILNIGICIRFYRIKKIKLWVVELDLIIFFCIME